MRKIFNKIFLFTLPFFPSITFADISCEQITRDNISGILKWASCILGKQVLPVLITLGVVGFIYGIIKFYLYPGNEKEKEKGKEFITKGLIALFIMVSFWGIINIFISTFDLNNTLPSIPSIPESYYQ
jgi:hypothetical protein